MYFSWLRLFINVPFDTFNIYNQYSNHQGEDLDYLDGEHCVFGELVEGWDILDKVNETICDGEDRPYQVSLLERFF